MKENAPIKGYKVFNPDWTCTPVGGKKFQYKVGKTYTEDGMPTVCLRGFHFCKNAADCFRFYRFDPNNKVAEVLALGDVETAGPRSCTNKIRIMREVPWAELLEIVNTGERCTGLGNSGDRNNGSWNSGDCNRGDSNSGNYNCGYRNSGGHNSGNWNSGDCNNGYRNSGYRNSGDWNSGNCNRGDRNSGDWNKCNFSSGCFNTVEQEIYLFNRPSEWRYGDWEQSDARRLLDWMPGERLVYVELDAMTEEEKAAHPEAKVTGGYLRKEDMRSARADWWRGLSKEEKAVILSIPNFDREIFLEITGIDVGENP